MDEVSFYENFSVPNPHLRSALLREIADGKGSENSEKRKDDLYSDTRADTRTDARSPRQLRDTFFLYTILPLACVRPRFVRQLFMN